jgi:glycerophosphoryl diester phosphodiesterase
VGRRFEPVWAHTRYIRLVTLPLSKSKFIYAHRGIWDINTPNNSKLALERASKAGYSIETDIRLLGNKLVISHDAEFSGKEVCLDTLNFADSSVALNIKSDGLVTHVKSWLSGRLLDGTFVFDGSIPEMYKYSQHSIPHALRLSEFEPELPWMPSHIWLDAFTKDWWLTNQKVLNIIKNNKVTIVSPELHGRDPRCVWDFILDNINDFLDVSFCTDRPNDLWKFAQ